MKSQNIYPSLQTESNRNNFNNFSNIYEISDGTIFCFPIIKDIAILMKLETPLNVLNLICF